MGGRRAAVYVRRVQTLPHRSVGTILIGDADRYKERERGYENRAFASKRWCDVFRPPNDQCPKRKCNVARVPGYYYFSSLLSWLGKESDRETARDRHREGWREKKKETDRKRMRV